MRVRFVLAACALVPLVGCPPPSAEPPLPDEIGNIVNAPDPVSRLGALDEALDAARQRHGQTPAAICNALGALSEVAAASTQETFARRLVLYLGLLRCRSAEPLLRDCAVGEWTSRSGVLRASALAALADGTATEVFQVGTSRALAEQLATDPAALVRLAAFRVLLEDPSEPGSAEWARLAVEDEAEIVRHAATGLVAAPPGGAP